MESNLERIGMSLNRKQRDDFLKTQHVKTRHSQIHTLKSNQNVFGHSKLNTGKRSLIEPNNQHKNAGVSSHPGTATTNLNNRRPEYSSGRSNQYQKMHSNPAMLLGSGSNQHNLRNMINLYQDSHPYKGGPNSTSQQSYKMPQQQIYQQVNDQFALAQGGTIKLKRPVDFQTQQQSHDSGSQQYSHHIVKPKTDIPQILKNLEQYETQLKNQSMQLQKETTSYLSGNSQPETMLSSPKGDCVSKNKSVLSPKIITTTYNSHQIQVDSFDHQQNRTQDFVNFIQSSTFAINDQQRDQMSSEEDEDDHELEEEVNIPNEEDLEYGSEIDNLTKLDKPLLFSSEFGQQNGIKLQRSKSIPTFITSEGLQVEMAELLREAKGQLRSQSQNDLNSEEDDDNNNVEEETVMKDKSYNAQNLKQIGKKI